MNTSGKKIRLILYPILGAMLGITILWFLTMNWSGESTMGVLSLMVGLVMGGVLAGVHFARYKNRKDNF